eukprot:463372-Alexandrium_andersonii.AAC.1
MSASLVGSEMCIRDSHPREGQEGPLAARGSGLKGAWTAAHAQDFLASLSVSYTHLTLPTICSV